MLISLSYWLFVYSVCSAQVLGAVCFVFWPFGTSRTTGLGRGEVEGLVYTNPEKPESISNLCRCYLVLTWSLRLMSNLNHCFGSWTLQQERRLLCFYFQLLCWSHQHPSEQGLSVWVSVSQQRIESCLQWCCCAKQQKMQLLSICLLAAAGRCQCNIPPLLSFRNKLGNRSSWSDFILLYFILKLSFS